MSDLRTRLSQLVKELRTPDLDKIGRSMTNPLTGEPGYVFPDPYPAGASDEQIAFVSEQFRVPFPLDLRQWLRITNGAAGFFGVSPAHPGREIELIWKLRPEWPGRRWIPVGSDTFGNYYLRVPQIDSNSRGGVCFVEGTIGDQLVYVVASDTLHFAEFVLEMRTVMKSYDDRYGWPFDRAFVLSKDPKILDVKVAPMPWET